MNDGTDLSGALLIVAALGMGLQVFPLILVIVVSVITAIAFGYRAYARASHRPVLRTAETDAADAFTVPDDEDVTAS